MDVARPAGVLIGRERRPLGAAVLAAHRAEHLQVVAAGGLPMRGPELLRPLLEHEVVATLAEEGDRLLVAGDVLGPRYVHLVEDPWALRHPVDVVEAVTERPGGQYRHARVTAADRLAEHGPGFEEMLEPAV